MELRDDFIDNKIRDKMRELDSFYPANLTPRDALWQTIVSKRKKRRSQKILIRWSIAASVSLLMMAGFIWHMSGAEKYEGLTLSNQIITTQEDEALEYINTICMKNNTACASPAFKELKDELTASSTSLEEINQQISRFGSDANLLRAKSRIENHQARIIKAMIQTL